MFQNVLDLFITAAVSTMRLTYTILLELATYCQQACSHYESNAHWKRINSGVYKQWTGLLEWWNSGMVDQKVFVLTFIILSCLTNPIVFHQTSYILTHTQQQYIASQLLVSLMSHSTVLVRGLQGPCWVGFLNIFNALSDTQNLGVDYTIKR